MQTRSKTYEAMDFQSFEAHAFSVFTGASAHVAAPALLECVAHTGDAPLTLSEMPSVAALSEEGRVWVQQALVSCGFEMLPDGSLRASPETLDRLNKEKNAARRRAHIEAAASREQLLTDLLRELSRAAAEATTLAQARGALRTFLAAFDGQPAVGPLLLGIAALMRAQAAAGTTGQCWCLERAAVLNGGDAFVKQSMPLLRALGLRPNALADTEQGLGASAEEIALELAACTWTANELGAIAYLIERRCARQPMPGRASGRIDGSSRAFEARELNGPIEWLNSVVGCMLTRLSP